MMFNYPYFGMPFYKRYSRYGYRYPYTYSSKSGYKEKTQHSNESYSKINSNQKEKEAKTDLNCKASTNENTDAPLFQLFGISLYFDDVLLVCLILFLYQEGVKDEGLFIALILLLLS